MKLEIKKEFSVVYKSSRFYVYIDDQKQDGFDTEELAMSEIESIKKAYADKSQERIVYSEVV